MGTTDLTIANAYYVSNVNPAGGCIYSAGDVLLTRSVVSHCTVGGASASARGGGVLTKGSLTLSGSTITNSEAAVVGAPAAGDGGGAFVEGDFRAYYSTISNNTAYVKYANANSAAGGIHASGDVTIRGSTISGNNADIGGGIGIGSVYGHAATITDSTISGNTANVRVGGLLTNIALTLTNSTVAFNSAHASGASLGAGLYASWLLTLQSSIIADNASEAGPSDLGVGGLGAIVDTSASNLVTSSTVPLPVGTIQNCPQLGPLADNGGPTRTHALRHTSPALDNGNNVAGLVGDQRLLQRVVNSQADIGAVERQTGEMDDRLFVNGFDGLCDQ